MSFHIGCVLMASGFGARFGANKLLALADGVPLVQRAMETYREVDFARRVLVSQYDSVLDMAPAHGFVPLANPHAAQGISASVRLGTAAMEGMDGILFGVCDQPWLTTQSVNHLLGVFYEHPNSICALAHKGKKGNPVVFPRDLFPALLSLQGDTGGGQVIKAHPGRLLLTEVLDPHELDDIDRPEDLAP